MTAEIKCDDPKETRIKIDMAINFITTRHYYGAMKSLIISKDIKSASEGTINSTWRWASCKKW